MPSLSTCTRESGGDERASAADLTPPGTPQETGLPALFLLELTLKILMHGGQLRLWTLAKRLCLPPGVVECVLEFARDERLCEVVRGGLTESERCFQLTDAGRRRAEDALAKSRYVGPAPVSLEAYIAQVTDQGKAAMRLTREVLRQAFTGVVVQQDLLDRIGAALNSRSSIFFYGPSGSGKTYIAERMARALSGHVYVPHAILVDEEVIVVYDPAVHTAVPQSAPQGDGLERRRGADERWVLCERPVVVAGGELTLAMLDLRFEPDARFYVAPLQVKANNGLLLIDDLGRQLVDARDLMNRWIVPLDRQVDYLALHTGKKFQVPFDARVVFSSNMRPSELADDAFLRRLGYKIHVGPLTENQYREVFHQVCERQGLTCDEALLDYLLREHHRTEDQPLLACLPRDILGKVCDRWKYEGERRNEVGREILDWAWRSYFAVE